MTYWIHPGREEANPAGLLRLSNRFKLTRRKKKTMLGIKDTYWQRHLRWAFWVCGLVFSWFFGGSPNGGYSSLLKFGAAYPWTLTVNFLVSSEDYAKSSLRRKSTGYYCTKFFKQVLGNIEEKNIVEVGHQRINLSKFQKPTSSAVVHCFPLQNHKVNNNANTRCRCWCRLASSKNPEHILYYRQVV
jgi:hypothetical protein